MKRKVFAIALSLVLVLSITGCGETIVTVFDEPASIEEQTSIDESSVEETVDEPEDSEFDDEFIAGQQVAISGYLKNYLVSGSLDYEGTFVSPETQTPYLSPCFAFDDVNGDGLKEIIVYGYLGIRDKRMGEVYYLDLNDGCFKAATFSGVLDAATFDNCFLVSYEDRDTSEPIYYTDYYVYRLTGDLIDVYESTDGVEEVLMSHSVESYVDSEDGEITNTYYSYGCEITKDEFYNVYNQYTDAEKPISYQELTMEAIEELFD